MPETQGLAVKMSPAVSAALRDGRPVVALESSVFAQGLPVPHNRDAAERMVRAVEKAGAVPAIAAVVRGVPTLGLEAGDLERFLARDGVVKVSARDIPWAMAKQLDGATTVAATLLIADRAGVRVFATGGIGGVHREVPGSSTWVRDESADLIELSRTRVLVICAGAKSILDVPATMERLETLGVPIIGYRTSEMPGFHTRGTGLRLAARAETAAEIVAAWRASRLLGQLSGMLVVQPPPAEVALERSLVEGAVRRALDRASEQHIIGAAVTPFLLGALEKATGGDSLTANLGLLEANAALAGEIAVALEESSGADVRPKKEGTSRAAGRKALRKSESGRGAG